MKARANKTFMVLAVMSLLVLTGCKDERRTAMWWMPSPWSPVTWFYAPVTDGGNANGGAGGGSGAGGGGGGGMNTGGGYNVGGGVPGLGM